MISEVTVLDTLYFKANYFLKPITRNEKITYLAMCALILLEGMNNPHSFVFPVVSLGALALLTAVFYREWTLIYGKDNYGRGPASLETDKKWADCGCPCAQKRVGDYYSKNPDGHAEALKYYSLAAERGNFSALDKLYPSKLKNWHFGCVKAPGLKSKKTGQYFNMNLFFLIQPRELSRGPNANF